jgi:hypothetical protein
VSASERTGYRPWVQADQELTNAALDSAVPWVCQCVCRVGYRWLIKFRYVRLWFVYYLAWLLVESYVVKWAMRNVD